MIYFTFKCKSRPADRGLKAFKLSSFLEKCFLRLLTRVIPEANPDFDDKIGYVAEWYLEFEDEEEPWREIGLDVNGQVIVKMPDERNYGFWLDTGMKLEDFKRQFQLQPISEREFNDLWNSVCYDRKEGKFKKSENNDGAQGNL